VKYDVLQRFNFFVQLKVSKIMNRTREQFSSYAIHAGLKHFVPGFGFDVFGLFGIEGFSEFFSKSLFPPSPLK
jgi:hypothetical protein